MPPITNQMLNCGESTAASTSVIDRSKLHGYLTGSLSTVLWWSCHCSIDGAGAGLISSLDCTRLENCHQANIEHMYYQSAIPYSPCRVDQHLFVSWHYSIQLSQYPIPVQQTRKRNVSSLPLLMAAKFRPLQA